MKEIFISKSKKVKSLPYVPHQEDWGNIHPEMEDLKLKYKDKDFFILNHYEISSFLRLLYEGEEETLNPAFVDKACGGEPCIGLLVLKVVDKKLGITEVGRGRGMYFLNEEDFDAVAQSAETPVWIEEEQGLYVPEKMLKKEPKGFKNKS